MIKFVQIEAVNPDLDIVEVRDHLRIGDDSSQDDLLKGLMAAALQICSDYVGEPLVDTVFEAYYPVTGEVSMTLPHRTVIRINSILVFNDLNIKQAVYRESYVLDPTQHYPCVSLVAPITSTSKFGAPIVVAYTAGPGIGAGTATGKSAFKIAQLLVISDLYLSPVSFSVENTSNNRVTYPAVYRLLAPFRSQVFNGI